MRRLRCVALAPAGARVGGGAVALAMGVLAGFSPAVALAHWNAPSSFGVESMGIPVGVAVDQSTANAGDVYVADLGGGGNDSFDSSHALRMPPSPFGGAPHYSGAAVNPTNGDVYVVD